MLTHIKSSCIHSTDGVAGDRAQPCPVRRPVAKDKR